MEKVLFAMMTAFGRVFLVTFLIAATGILAAPNQASAVALSWAALLASIVAGLRAIQIFIPGLTFAKLLSQPFAAWADSFARAFLATFITLMTGWLASPEHSTWKSAVIAILIGALTSGVRALQGFVTSGDTPAPTVGLGSVKEV